MDGAIMTIFDAFPFVLWEEALATCEPLLFHGVFNKDTRAMGTAESVRVLWGWQPSGGRD
jgi:hypothetical protein